MTTQEFSIEFDILYNNLASNAAPPLNEYEKSVFLTKAQSDIVLELYSGRNNLGLSYESAEEVRKYLSVLNTKKEHFLTMANFLEYPTDILFRTRMEFQRDGMKPIPVILVSQDDIARISNNPFKNGDSNRRIIAVETEGGINFISPLSLSGTLFIYGIKKPNPIILDDILDLKLTIDGTHVAKQDDNETTLSNSQTSELPEILHSAILDRAVLLAKQAYIGGQTQA